MMATKLGTSVSCIFSILTLAGFVGHAAAQAFVSLDEYLDCVVEPKSTIELGSPEEGIIWEVKVERGDTVKQGAVVAKLDTNLQILALEMARLRAESDVEIRSHRARLAFREIETKRVEMLHAKSIVATKVLEEAAIEKRLTELTLETATREYNIARVQLAQAKEQLERRFIRSPVDGVVVEVTMAPGEFAHEQSPVMIIAEIDPLHVEVFVPVAYYGRMSVGTRAQVIMEAPIGGVHSAQVTVVDRVFDAASRTFGVRLVLPNPNHELPAGLTCRVRFLEDRTVQGISVDSDLDLLSPESMSDGTNQSQRLQ